MKKFGILSLSTMLAAGSMFTYQNVHAASTTANATQVVIAAIAISKVSDLDFGTGIQGDAALPVAPGSSENASNASFSVTGNPNATYTIDLPADSTIKMITGGGGSANTEINVDSFVSNPAEGTGGTLSAGGSQTLFVGATRAALLATQTPGSYTGSFTVTVAY